MKTSSLFVFPTAAATLFAGLSILLVLTTLPAPADEVGPRFHGSFDKARDESKESGKPLIAIFSASWCPPCQQMKKSVYPSKEVQPFHKSFVWAYLDADESENRSVMTQFQVSGIPHIAFVTADGEVIGQFAGAIPPADFAKVLAEVLDKAGASETTGTTAGPSPQS